MLRRRTGDIHVDTLETGVQIFRSSLLFMSLNLAHENNLDKHETFQPKMV